MHRIQTTHIHANYSLIWKFQSTAMDTTKMHYQSNFSRASKMTVTAIRSGLVIGQQRCNLSVIPQKNTVG